MRDPISMSFCISDSFSQHLAVAIVSFLSHNPKACFVFHVLHSGISDANIAKIKEIELSYHNCRIVFHEINRSIFNHCAVPPELEHVSIETFYRYVIPEILADEKRTIYSDVDVVCNGNILPLWEMDLGDNIAAMVPEGPSGRNKRALLGLDGEAPYFYAGLMLMDLEKMRAESCTSRFFACTVDNIKRLAWADQDVINIVLDGQILCLGEEWDGINVTYSPFQHGIAIWHFTGFIRKPWCNIWKNTTWPIYLKYLLKSPYRANSVRFVWGHIKGFFFFKYTKKRITRYLVCGIRVWKTREAS